VPVEPGGPPCYCGIRGCLESLASGTAIAEAGRTGGWREARAVFGAAAAGDATAQQIVERACDAAAVAAWTFVHTFLPQRLVLGGGMMDEHYERFARGIEQRLSGATQFTRANVTLARATLGNDAAWSAPQVLSPGASRTRCLARRTRNPSGRARVAIVISKNCFLNVTIVTSKTCFLSGTIAPTLIRSVSRTTTRTGNLREISRLPTY